MAQHDYVIDNQPGSPFRGDLNLALQAIVGLNAGIDEPTFLFPGMLWLDIAATTLATYPNGRLRMRNRVNNAWVDVPDGGVPAGGGTMSGNLIIQKDTPQVQLVPSASGQIRQISGMAADGLSSRWAMRLGNATAEGTPGSNVGSDFELMPRKDDGSQLPPALLITRSNGLISIGYGQLKFPATANPSADPNTLDDYKETDWTPQLQFGGANVGMVQTASTFGHAIKVGRTAYATCRILLSAKGTSTGAAAIIGLPWAAAQVGGVQIGYFNAMTGMTGLVPAANVGGNGFTLRTHGAAAGQATLTDAQFTNTSDIVLSATYAAVN